MFRFLHALDSAKWGGGGGGGGTDDTVHLFLSDLWFTIVYKTNVLCILMA